MMARNANTVGICPGPVKPAIIAENPGPPKVPKVFCIPWGRIMIPTARRITVSCHSLLVASSFLSIGITMP